MTMSSTPSLAQAAVRQFTDSVKTLVWMTDTDGLATYLSRDVSRLFDKGTALSFEAYVNFIHPEDRARVAETFWKATAEHNEFQMDYRFIGKDAKLHWVSASGAPRFSDSGDFCGYI